ncbi:hypothetical protein STCU_05304 [Strigomonas culicis]|nr:hypothetical protein STCU_05304 [Strigomonas culicis]|eukprot:EPY28094.1 hypothetical protein STCU_05304 [Strigomonas culicis]
MDRRVMIVTEKTALLTTALVLDLQFSYPLSRGNSMFPEVFWGHEVLDGGYSQIGFTMPPTAQITILHTLEPPTEANEPQYMRWLKWREEQPKGAASANPRKQHLSFCRPLIEGQVLDDGTREPTLYLSRMDAIPYLATIVAGQPRSALRVYWGCMRWSTAQIEAEVANGHWMALQVSPSFYRAYTVLHDEEECFPTVEELRETKAMRVRRYGADISMPQAFPPDQIMRRRECLWDEMLYALGGEFTALVGCSNPFSGYSDRANPHILSALPLVPAPVTLPDVQPLEEDFDLTDLDTGSGIRAKSASWGKSAAAEKDAGEAPPGQPDAASGAAAAAAEEEEKDKKGGAGGASRSE